MASLTRVASREIFEQISEGEFQVALDTLRNPAIPDVVKKNLARATDLDDEFHTCLHVAVELNAPTELVQALLQYIGPNEGNFHQRTPTYLAARHNASIATMDLLIRAGGKLNGLTDRYTFTPLMAACYRRADVNLVGRLIYHGADPATKDGNGRTAMKWAMIENWELGTRVDNGRTLALYLESFPTLLAIASALDIKRLRRNDKCLVRMLPKDLWRLVRAALVLGPTNV